MPILLLIACLLTPGARAPRGLDPAMVHAKPPRPAYLRTRVLGRLDPWRRTTRGWEHRSQWLRRIGPRTPAQAIPPWTVAALLALVSLAALVAFAPTTPHRLRIRAD